MTSAASLSAAGRGGQSVLVVAARVVSAWAGMASSEKPPAPAGLSERMKGMLAEYGGIAVFVYLALFAAVLAGFAVAISSGVEVESAAGGVGTFAAAWLATKLTQPLRILATLGLTPLVAAGLRRLRRAPAAPASAPTDPNGV